MDLEIISINSDDSSRKTNTRKRSRSRYGDEDPNKRKKTRHRGNETEDNSSEIIELFSDVCHKRKKGKRKKKKRRRSKSYCTDYDKQMHVKKENKEYRIKKETVFNIDSDYSENNSDYSENSSRCKKLRNERKDYSYSSKNHSRSVKSKKYQSIDSDRHKRKENDIARNKKEKTNLDNRQNERERSKYENLDNRQRERSKSEWVRSEKFDHRRSEREGFRYDNLDHRQSETERSKKIDYIQNDRERLTNNNIDERKKLDDIGRRLMILAKYGNMDQGQKEKEGISYENFDPRQSERERTNYGNIDQRQSERERTNYGNIDQRQSERGQSDNFDHLPTNGNSSKYGNDKERCDIMKNGQKYNLYEINDKEDNISSNSFSNILTLKKALKRIESNGKERTEKSMSFQENNERELGSSLYKNPEEILLWITNTEKESAKDFHSEPDITSSVENEMQRDADIDIITEIRKPQKHKPSNPSHTQSGIEIVNVNDEPRMNNLDSLNRSLTSNPLYHQKRMAHNYQQHEPNSSYQEYDPQSSRLLKHNQEKQCQSSKNPIRSSDFERQKSSEMNTQSTSSKGKRLLSNENSDFVSILEKFPNIQKAMELASSYNFASSSINISSESVVNKCNFKNDSQNKNSHLISQEEIVLCDTEVPQGNVYSHAVSSKGVSNTSEPKNFESKEKSFQYNQSTTFSAHDNRNKYHDNIENKMNKKEIRNDTNIWSKSVADKNVVNVNSQYENSLKQHQNKFIIPSQEEVILCDTDTPPVNVHTPAVSLKGNPNRSEINIFDSKNKSSQYSTSANFSKHANTNKYPDNIKDRINEKEIKDNCTTILSEKVLEKSIVRNNSQNKNSCNQPPKKISIPSREEIVLCDTEISPVNIQSRGVSSLGIANTSNIFDSIEKSSQFNISIKTPKHDNKDKFPDTIENRNIDKETKNGCTDTISNFIKQYKIGNDSISITASQYLFIYSNESHELHSSKVNANELQSVQNEERKAKKVKDLALRVSPNETEQGKNDIVDQNRPRTLLNPSKSWNLRVAAAKEKNKNKIQLLNKNLVARNDHNSSTTKQINNNESIKAPSLDVCQNKTHIFDGKDVDSSSKFIERNKTDDNSCLASSKVFLKPTFLNDKCSSSENSGKLCEIENVQGNIIFNDDDSSGNDLNTFDVQTSGIQTSDSCVQIKKENIIMNSSVNTEKDDKGDSTVSNIKEEIVFSNEIHLETIYDTVDSKAFIRSMVSHEYLEKDRTESKVSLHQSIRAEGLLSDGLDNDNIVDKIQENLPDLEEDLLTRVPDDEFISDNDIDVNYSESENEMQN